MKQVYLCIPTLASAGAERFVTELACNLDQTRYEPTVLVTKHLEYNSTFYKLLLSHNIRVINVGDCSYFKTIRKTVKLLNTEKPAIIHTNVGAALHMLVPQLLSFSKIKHIFTTHSMGYRIFKGVKKKIVKVCFKAGIIIPVAICDTVKQSLVESYGLKPDRVECVYNGVDINKFMPKANDSKEENINLVSVGTLYYIKNHKLLVDAFKLAHDKNSGLRLTIAGDGELKEDLLCQIKQLELDNYVKLIGNQNNVEELLRTADLYCCTSTVEGLPISVLEAMACGLPIITTPAGGVVDIVDNKNGIIVDFNAQNIANEIIALASNITIREKMGANSRKKAEYYSIENCAKQYMQIYDKNTKG